MAIGNRKSIITLLTDFGTQDYFVGAMKGVILSINAGACIVDISNEIPAQDIRAAAFNLLASYQSFPAATIHVAVVDPGVGSSRRPILISCADQFFVGPDNGIFSWVCQREQAYRAFHLTNDKFFRQPVSATFHGRDIFAPVAAALSQGVPPEELGVPLGDLIQLESIKPVTIDKGVIEARIIHIDRFGNCVTSLTPEYLSGSARLMINDHEISSFREFFADTANEQGEIFCYVGSAGFIEIAARNAPAAEVLSARCEQTVMLHGPARK